VVTRGMDVAARGSYVAAWCKDVATKCLLSGLFVFVSFCWNLVSYLDIMSWQYLIVSFVDSGLKN